MRYFKYSGPWEDIESLKVRYVGLSEQARKDCRREKLLHRLGTAVFVTVMLVLWVGLLFLIRLVQPTEADALTAILFCIIGLPWVFISLFISAVVGAIAASPLWGIHRKSWKQRRQQLLHDASSQLREFYGFREPFLVTKCYQSSDRQFDRHDVCIFIVDGELRITANLHYGFFDPKRDLGCYGLTRQELSLRDAQYKDRSAVELRAGELSFLLGCRAKAFIDSYICAPTVGEGLDPPSA